MTIAKPYEDCCQLLLSRPLYIQYRASHIVLVFQLLLRGYTGASELVVLRQRKGSSAREFSVANSGTRHGIAYVVATGPHASAVTVSPSLFEVGPKRSETVRVSGGPRGAAQIAIYMLDDVLVAWGRQDALAGRPYAALRERVQTVELTV